MPNLTIYGEVDSAALAATVQFLKQNDVNVVIRDKALFNEFFIKKTVRDKEVQLSKESGVNVVRCEKEPHERKDTCSDKGGDKASASCSKAVNIENGEVLSKRMSGQRARRERERIDQLKYASKREVAQRFRRVREKVVGVLPVPVPAKYFPSLIPNARVLARRRRREKEKGASKHSPKRPEIMNSFSSSSAQDMLQDKPTHKETPVTVAARPTDLQQATPADSHSVLPAQNIGEEYFPVEANAGVSAQLQQTASQKDMPSMSESPQLEPVHLPSSSTCSFSMPRKSAVPQHDMPSITDQNLEEDGITKGRSTPIVHGEPPQVTVVDNESGTSKRVLAQRMRRERERKERYDKCSKRAQGQILGREKERSECIPQCVQPKDNPSSHVLAQQPLQVETEKVGEQANDNPSSHVLAKQPLQADSEKNGEQSNDNTSSHVVAQQPLHVNTDKNGEQSNVNPSHVLPEQPLQVNTKKNGEQSNDNPSSHLLDQQPLLVETEKNVEQAGDNPSSHVLPQQPLQEKSEKNGEQSNDDPSSHVVDQQPLLVETDKNVEQASDNPSSHVLPQQPLQEKSEKNGERSNDNPSHVVAQQPLHVKIDKNGEQSNVNPSSHVFPEQPFQVKTKKNGEHSNDNPSSHLLAQQPLLVETEKNVEQSNDNPSSHVLAQQPLQQEPERKGIHLKSSKREQAQRLRRERERGQKSIHQKYFPSLAPRGQRLRRMREKDEVNRLRSPALSSTTEVIRLGSVLMENHQSSPKRAKEVHSVTSPFANVILPEQPKQVDENVDQLGPVLNETHQPSPKRVKEMHFVTSSSATDILQETSSQKDNSHGEETQANVIPQSSVAMVNNQPSPKKAKAAHSLEASFADVIVPETLNQVDYSDGDGTPTNVLSQIHATVKQPGSVMMENSPPSPKRAKTMHSVTSSSANVVLLETPNQGSVAMVNKQSTPNQAKEAHSMESSFTDVILPETLNQIHSYAIKQDSVAILNRQPSPKQEKLAPSIVSSFANVILPETLNQVHANGVPSGSVVLENCQPSPMRAKATHSVVSLSTNSILPEAPNGVSYSHGDDTSGNNISQIYANVIQQGLVQMNNHQCSPKQVKADNSMTSPSANFMLSKTPNQVDFSHGGGIPANAILKGSVKSMIQRTSLPPRWGLGRVRCMPPPHTRFGREAVSRTRTHDHQVTFEQPLSLHQGSPSGVAQIHAHVTQQGSVLMENHQASLKRAEAAHPVASSSAYLRDRETHNQYDIHKELNSKLRSVRVVKEYKAEDCQMSTKKVEDILNYRANTFQSAIATLKYRASTFPVPSIFKRKKY